MTRPRTTGRIRSGVAVRATVLIGVIMLTAVLGTGAARGHEPAGAPDPSRRQCARDQVALRAIPARIEATWARGDADGFAMMFTPDADFVVGDGTYLEDRDAVLDYMRAGFAGPLIGTRVTVELLDVRCLSRSVAVMHTTGGILLPGETEVPPERIGIQTAVFAKRGAQWLVTAYQNTRIDEA